MELKKYIDKTVLEAAEIRIKYIFDNFEKIYLSFSGGKDSTIILHLAMKEAYARNRKIGILLIDFEAQYKHTMEHSAQMFEKYKSNIELYWVCLPIKLRNAVSAFEPTWTCWDPARKNDWVRAYPKMEGVITNDKYFPFFIPEMEFEEFIILFGEWYAAGEKTAAIIGIRADESLNRFRTIATFKKETYEGMRWTTKILENLYNVYPIYDWKTSDVWKYHSANPDKEMNAIYTLMYKAGVPFSKQRLCQPYGDDQRRGLWLYHMLEPETWYKLLIRVNGANSGALYVQETGNITGYNKIQKPEGHTYKSFCNLLLATMPKVTRDHFIARFRVFLKGWISRGYPNGIPDEAPYVLEQRYWAPSWRRLCKVLLRNDWWCKGLGMTQPKSEAYGKYLQIKREKQRIKKDK